MKRNIIYIKRTTSVSNPNGENRTTTITTAKKRRKRNVSNEQNKNVSDIIRNKP